MDLDREGLLKLYNTMTTIRHFEERGIPETGQRGMSASVHSSAGQEAVPVGVCANLTDEDYIGSTHRGHGHCIAKGVDVKQMMAVTTVGTADVVFVGEVSADTGGDRFLSGRRMHGGGHTPLPGFRYAPFFEVADRGHGLV